MEDGPTAPFLYPEAMAYAKPKSATTQEESLFSKVSMVDMLKYNVHIFLSFNPFVFFRLLFIQQIDKSCKLLFSGLFSKQVNTDSPFKIFILDKWGGLKRVVFNSTDEVERLNRINTRIFSKQQNLCDLVGLGHFEPDPTNYQETITFLTKHNLLNSVYINYCFTSSVKGGSEYWNDPAAPTLYIEAFTTSSYKLGFRLNKIKVRQKLKRDLATAATSTETKASAPTFDLLTRANRSSAVSAHCTGLNLAYSLGLVTLEQLSRLAIEFGKCSVSIWMEYDDNFVARYVTVFSAHKDFHQFEIKSREGDFSSWKKLFDLLYKIKDVMAERKKKLLQILLYKLQSTSSQKLNSPYKKCAKQLELAIRQLKIVLFSTDDTCIHAIKLTWATYLKEKRKKFSSITLNANAANILNMLKTDEMIFFNLNMYLSEESVYSTTVTTPFLSKSIANLYHHPKQDFASVITMCKQRGKEIAPQLISSWQTVGQFFLTHFHLDIFALHFSSLSYLAFTAVWLKYSRINVVFHQGLEKIKPAYETIFRSFSQGGFSYSCQDYLECGGPILGSEGGEAASTLLSFDIISSYGYAGSKISNPTGFCNAYFENEIGVLQLTEPYSRHNSFEFLSVYYTLHILSKEKLEIKTVYSNFHMAGPFLIGNYPLDLAVVFTNGDISIYQFDGAYAHGCRKGCWLGNKSFIGGKPRNQLEEQSDKRDESIMAWVRETNKSQAFKSSYTVITDCHDIKYSIKALKEYFSHSPILSNLVRDYPSRKTLSKDDVLLCTDSLTFLIVLEGFVPLRVSAVANSATNKPLLIKNKQTSNWERRHATTPGNPILMSRDFLSWLMKKYNFQVTRIHSVFFYKRCENLNLIFKELTELRVKANISPSEKQLVKNVINFTAGYFGLNEKKQKGGKIYKLMQGTGKSFNLLKHEAQFVGSWGENDFFIKITKKKINQTCKLSIAPLAIFVSIVEFGKMRLSQILCFFSQYLMAGKYRHLYSNIDNVLLVLSTRTLRDAVDPQLMEFFLAESNSFFAPNSTGHFKQELEIEPEQEWKFASAVIMNYVVTTLDPTRSVSKSLFTNYSNKNVFDYTCKMLNKQQIVVKQSQRVNKILNKNVTIKMLNFNKTT